MTKKRQKNTSFSSQHHPLQTQVLDRKLARRDAKQLGLNKADLPNSIKEVIATLNEAGFEAYIVGGGVRDSLLGLKPKDFDAVTNATPNQIKEVFGKRCRIIGRRFLLCHVYSGRDMIEVATFRAPPKDDSHLTEDGMIMRDNVWGDISQDVVRRDFSINAMYYQPLEGFVYDFCGGLNDIKTRTIRLLGDTQKRVEEDPVRLLRALRFKAKLGFHFDDALEAQFNPQNWALLKQVSPHRLYDETQKMFTGGYLTPLLPLLFDYKAFNALLFYPPSLITPLIDQVTVNTDKRIGQGKSINPAFFYAALLWENYLYLLDKFKKNTPFVEAQSQATNKVMDKQRPHTAMPKFAEQFIKDIWLMQPRLAEPRKKNLMKLFENPRFRAGFDFLMMREQVEAKNRALSAELGQAVTLDNESTNGMGHWWAWFQTLNAKQQQKAIDEFDINAVRLRFANLVNGDNAVSHTNHAQPNQRRERRAEKRLAERGKKSYLTEQEQQEKNQLQMLSLANDTSNNNEPAQPLWGTPFNHQVAETETIAPVVAAEINERQTIDDSNAQGLPKRTRNERKKTNRDERLATQIAHQIPTTRKRRVPSSDLSVIEQRELAEQTAETLKKEPTATDKKAEKVASPTLPIADTPIPKKRTRKKVVETENAETVKTENVTAEKKLAKKPAVKKPATQKASVKQVKADKVTVETNQAVESVKPKRTPRPRKKAVQSVDNVAENTVTTVTETLEPVAKPPVKRTRKRSVKTGNDGE